MHLLYLLFIALINSIDNIGIRIAYSIGGIKVQLRKNLLISLMAFAVSFTASFSGNVVSHFLSESTSSILSMLLLAFTGIKIMLEPYFEKDEEKIAEKNLSYRQAISVGIALALDDIGGAVGVGLVGYSPFAVGSAFFIVSFLIFLGGNYMIKVLSRITISPKVTAALAGVIMIAIGISQIIA